MYFIFCIIMFIVGVIIKDPTLLIVSGMFAIANAFEIIGNAIKSLKNENKK